MDKVSAVILTGGQGTRLLPFTDKKAKPPTLFTGTSQMTDSALCGCFEAGVDAIYVLTQYCSDSVNKHIQSAYPICPQIKTISYSQLGVSFEEAADALRMIRHELVSTDSEHILILSGDQIQDFDYESFFAFARKQNADLCLAALPVSRQDAKRMRVLQMDTNCQLIQFAEKPKSDILLNQMKSPSPDLPELPHLGSMGIYLFKKEALIRLLEKDLRSHFDKHLIPSQIKKAPTYCYVHTGYWEDIYTIGTFYKAHTGLIDKSILPLIDHSTRQKLINMKGSIILRPNVTLGKNCKAEKTIIDENSYIGHGAILTNQNSLRSFENQNVSTKDGIIVVKPRAHLPNRYT